MQSHTTPDHSRGNYPCAKALFQSSPNLVELLKNLTALIEGYPVGLTPNQATCLPITMASGQVSARVPHHVTANKKSQHIELIARAKNKSQQKNKKQN